MSQTILVLGCNGQVARELDKIGPPPAARRSAAGLGLVWRPDRGVPCPRRIRQSPAAVINAAGYTAVDKAESEPEAAFRLNRDVPGDWARACAARDIPFIQLSTDYVFDGSKPAPYLEDDPTTPISVYGLSKAGGEREVTAAGGRAAILRTSWVYSAFGANFVKTMLRLAQTRDELAVVDDQLGRPTWAEDCARGALRLVQALLDREGGSGGIFHLSGAGDATWADFAEAIFDESVGGPRPRVRRISTADYPTPAKRPANSRLDCNKILRTLDWPCRPWREGLSACLKELEAQRG